MPLRNFARKTWAPLAAVSFSIALLAVIGLTATAVLMNAYERELKAAEVRAEASAAAAAAHFRWLIEASFQSLARIEDRFEEQLSQGAVMAEVQMAVQNLPDGLRIWLFDDEGRPVYTLPSVEAPQRLNASDRDYFTALQDGEERHVSGMLTGRISGEKSFVLSLRLSRGDEFAGVAAVGLPNRVITELWEALELDEHSSIGLVRTDGTLVGRQPPASENVNLKDHPLFTTHLPKAPAGVYHSSASPADGISRIVAYSRVPNLPLVAIVGLSRDAALAEFWHQVAVASAIGLPVALGLLAASVWLAYLMRVYQMQTVELTNALQKNETLLVEIHHRVKNNLSTAVSLVRLQPINSAVKEDLTGRLLAMAAVHELLYRSGQFDRVNLDKYLLRLGDTLRSYASEGVEFHFALEPVEISPAAATPIGLIISEVATNALKHAFPDGRKGTVTFALHATAEAVFITIRDDGVGFNVDRQTEGFGTRLVRSLASQIGATTRYVSTTGTRFEMRMPIHSVAANTLEQAQPGKTAAE